MNCPHCDSDKSRVLRKLVSVNEAEVQQRSCLACNRIYKTYLLTEAQYLEYTRKKALPNLKDKLLPLRSALREAERQLNLIDQ